MLVFPYSTDVHDGRIRMAAMLMMGLCLVVHLFVGSDASRVEERVYVLVEEFQGKQDWAALQLDSIPATELTMDTLNRRAEAHYQQAVAELTERVRDMRRATLMYRLGLTPARLNLLNLLSYMFVHGGWMHLLGNMLFFYVCGVAMEKYWGFWRFLVAYLLCGIIAGLFYMATTMFAHADVREIPLVGASGAIAGAMGAFVVTHAKVKVKMFYLVALWWRGTFRLPSYMYFGLWFGMQLLSSAIEPEHSSGVAYSAHIGGFLIGALLGVFIKSEDEASLVVPAHVMRSVQRRQTTPRAALPESMQRTAGPPGGAQQLAREPRGGSADVSGAEAHVMAQSEAALRQGDAVGASSLLTRAIDHYLQAGDQRRGELAEAVQFLLRNHSRLCMPAAQLYQWAKGLLHVRLFPPAIACFDVAAASADSPHLRNNSLIAAATVRIRVGIQRDRARADLERVAADATSGLFAQEARRILRESFD